jgi:hypothetical protein
MSTLTVRVACPDCGEIVVQHEDVVLRICEDTNTAEYTFLCYRCGRACAKNAPPAIVNLLNDHKFRTVVWRLPAELKERSHPAFTSKPPLVFQDLVRFVILLENDDQIAAAISEAS